VVWLAAGSVTVVCRVVVVVLCVAGVSLAHDTNKVVAMLKSKAARIGFFIGYDLPITFAPRPLGRCIKKPPACTINGSPLK
jgi:hypothetical protein